MVRLGYPCVKTYFKDGIYFDLNPFVNIKDLEIENFEYVNPEDQLIKGTFKLSICKYYKK